VKFLFHIDTSQSDIASLPLEIDINVSAVQPAKNSKQSSSTMTKLLGIIVGATIGGIGFIVLLVTAVLLLYNRRLVL